jgi:hypothetical protein
VTRLLSEKEGFRLVKDKKRKGGPAGKEGKALLKCLKRKTKADLCWDPYVTCHLGGA